MQQLAGTIIWWLCNRYGLRRRVWVGPATPCARGAPADTAHLTDGTAHLTHGTALLTRNACTGLGYVYLGNAPVL